jgi:putative FmdB family regulatory protein
MPFYEYQCSSCNHHLEALQKINDTPLRKCPECGRQTLKRLISAPVFRLKGGGWYETDFKSDKESKRNLVESDGDTKQESKDSGKEAGKDSSKEPSKDATAKDAGKASESKTESAPAKPEREKTVAKAKPLRTGTAKPAKAKATAKKRAKR